MDPLPFELVDLILENLDQHADFKSCALVSRAWCAPAQIRLFHTVSALNGVQCLRLHELLLAVPHITHLIRCLDFRIDDRASALLASSSLQLMNRLLYLTFVNGHWTWPGDQPHELSAILLYPIAATLARNPITHVQLYGFSLCKADLQFLFAKAFSLKHLILENFTSIAFDNRPLVEVSDGASVEQLESLHLILNRDSFMLCEWLCQPNCSIDTTHLRSFIISYDPEHNHNCFEPITRILRTAGPSLHELTIGRIRPEPSTQLQSLPWNLAHNPSLRSLTLDLIPDIVYSPSHCPPRPLESAVSLLPRPSQIQELNLCLAMANCDFHTLRYSNHTGWQVLASSLTLEAFPMLQVVRVILTLPVDHLGMIEDLANREIVEFKMQWVLKFLDIREARHHLRV
ncbi:hypothetical protein D9615_005088 [Tricholomella constricta]|uniref:F-box domain-containing protein n=1 Tax=Tricholomella constricta TaxID=117010 RepID=A0A8H5HGU4_9AGAR|nr:hypothetical protein D9615_005088 [Tricholomella constricta]